MLVGHSRGPVATDRLVHTIVCPFKLRSPLRFYTRIYEFYGKSFSVVCMRNQFSHLIHFCSKSTDGVRTQAFQR